MESTFCRDFVGEYEAFGDVKRVPLIPNGFNTPVTNANRQRNFIINYIFNIVVVFNFTNCHIDLMYIIQNLLIYMLILY